MKIAIIGRTEVLYKTAFMLRDAGHEIVCILTAKEAPEYTRDTEDFMHLAHDWGIPFASSSKISEHHKLLASVEAKIAISINYSGIIPSSVTDLFPLGILNAHGGDLPRYRGNACQAWAILNGEKQIGLCVHRMIGGELDNGDIITRDYFPVDLNTKVTQVLDWMSKRTPELFVDAVSRLSYNSNYILETQSKDPNRALRCYPRKPADGSIDWNESSIRILRLINASNRPYTGAFCCFEGQKLTIWDAALVEDFEEFCAVPGQVTKIGIDFVEVACGQGKIRLNQVEFSNRVINPNLLIRSIRQRLTSNKD